MSASDGLDQLAERLYALPPADFVPARDDAVAAARSAGDRAGAAAIAKLRRPTVAAWLVNLLVLRRPEVVDELLELGASLRSAQHELRGTALRELATKRRAAIAALVAQARDLAVAAGAGRSNLPIAEVEATLTAALADESVAREVRTGRLLKSVRYGGFGETPRPQLHVVPGERDTVEEEEVVAGEQDTVEEQKKPEPRAGRVDPTQVKHRLAEARSAVARAEEARTTTTQATEESTRRVADVEARLMELRRERVAANAALNDAERARVAAEQTLEAAKRSLAAAERAANRAGA